MISNLYRWCSQRKIDPENWQGVNPTKGFVRSPTRPYVNAKILNLEEAQALLAILKFDDAILTRRDYAFLPARLRLGVPLKKLQALQRKPFAFKAWDNMTHGMSAKSQPPEEVAAILAEEIAGTRVALRRTFHLAQECQEAHRRA